MIHLVGIDDKLTLKIQRQTNALAPSCMHDLIIVQYDTWTFFSMPLKGLCKELVADRNIKKPVKLFHD